MAGFAAENRFGWIIPVGLIPVAAIAPHAFLNRFTQREIVVVCMYTLITAGLNLSFGYGGQLALGQIAMFAGGAYITAILANHGMRDVLVCMAASIAAAGVIGLASGGPGMRLNRWSLAITSFFLVLLIPEAVVASSSESGGLIGLSVTTSPTILGIKLGWSGFFIFSVLVVAVTIALFRNLILSRHGNALRTLRESPLLVQACGLSVSRLRLRSYLLGSLPAGAAGCIYAFMVGYVQPEAFDLNLSIAILAASVVGGYDSIYGAVIGSTLLVFGPLQTNSFQRYSVLVYGLFLIIVGLLFRGGVAGLARDLLRRSTNAWGPSATKSRDDGNGLETDVDEETLDIPVRNYE